MVVQYRCKNERRLQTVLTQVGADGQFLNGIDYLEVSADRKTLTVHLLREQMQPLSPENIKISRRDIGTRVAHQFVDVVSVSSAGKLLTIGVQAPGDLSSYRLQLIQSATDLLPPAGFDPLLSKVDFSFFVKALSEFDCRPPSPSAEKAPGLPPIDYLAKDYASFRQLILDRMAVTMPEWVERSAADIGNVLVELLAYSADRLSYYQDAVATEAYLETARKRVSVRRHARLLDYFMHDGCSARAWVWLKVSAPAHLPGPSQTPYRSGTTLVTQTTVRQQVFDDEAFQTALNQQVPMFETLHDVVLHPACNEILVYTWGDEQCELPKGSTRATLRKTKGLHQRYLEQAVLIFEEVRGKESGLAAEANPEHRHPVRVVQVKETCDPLFPEVEIFEIEWHIEDALPFSFFVGTVKVDDVPQPVTVVRGNIVLADHGHTRKEPLPAVLEAMTYRPWLTFGPLTQTARVRDRQNKWVAFDPQASAQAALNWEMRHVQPSIFLTETDFGLRWHPQVDLLNSDRFAREFVVESEDDRARLRFGDGKLGRVPQAQTQLMAIYRTGNGLLGNVGSEAIAHIYAPDLPALPIIRIRNPLPATGGQNPEPIEQVQYYAPHAFRRQQRAVTEADYAHIAERFPGVQRAVATRRWTGSWYTIFITIDRDGGLPVDDGFKSELVTFLKGFRLAGHDIAIDSPRYVPLDIALTVQVKADYFPGTIKAVLLEWFSNKVLEDGRLGFFHTDNFSFGESIYMSPLIAMAMTVPGVQSVQVNRFQRWRQPDSSGLEIGELQMGRLEIGQLNNDPTQPELGRLQLEMEGGL